MASIHTVILAGRWGLWAEGSPYKHEGGQRASLVDAAGVATDNHAAFAAGLDKVVAKLIAAGKQVWLVGPIPEIGYDVPRTLYFDSRGVSHSIHIRPTRQEFDDRQAFVMALFADIAKKYHAQIVWPHQYLCDARFCRVEEDGHPLYVDDQHLTRSAAISMAAIFDPIFADPLPDRPVAATP